MNRNLGKPLSVSRFLGLLKQSVSRAFSQVLVTGEVLDPLVSQRGHLYFRLRDGRSEVRAVMWRREVQRLTKPLQPGDQVTVRANLDIYADRGDLQLVVQALMRSGRGQKLLELAQLREKLKSEGLLDRPRRPLPEFPATIGVISSVGSAVIHDIYQSVQRRWPNGQLLLSPSAVSGTSAAQELHSALKLLSGRCDVVIIARGGGSFEELLPFSDERLIRAVTEFPLPVVAAVGHGSDTTLLDLVADHTAPTPTAAAVLVTPDKEELTLHLAQMRQRLERQMETLIRNERRGLLALGRTCRAFHPEARLVARRRELMAMKRSLNSAITYLVSSRRSSLEVCKQQIKPGHLELECSHSRKLLEGLRQRLERAMQEQLRHRRDQLKDRSVRLRASGPKAILDRGYVLVDSSKGLVTKVQGRTVGEELELHFADGRMVVEVKQISTESDKNDTSNGLQ